MTNQPPGPPYDFDPQKTRFLFDLDLKANGSSFGGITEQEIAAFGKWLRDRKNEEVILYHGTSAKHPVMDKGLLPTTATRRRSIQSGSGYVYLSYDPNRALTFAQFGYPMEGRFAVYAVKLPIRSLLADADQLANKRFYAEKKDIGSTLAHSFIYGAGARHKGRIEPWRISLHGIFDKGGHRVQENAEHPMRRIMEIAVALTESTQALWVALDTGSTIRVVRNPSADALIATTKNSRWRNLRGLANGTDAFWWDSHEATHGDVARALGIADYTDHRLRCHMDREGYVHLDWIDDGWQRHPRHLQFRRYMRSEWILFDAGSHGMLSGPEYYDHLREEGVI